MVTEIINCHSHPSSPLKGRWKRQRGIRGSGRRREREQAALRKSQELTKGKRKTDKTELEDITLGVFRHFQLNSQKNEPRTTSVKRLKQKVKMSHLNTLKSEKDLLSYKNNKTGLPWWCGG